MTKELFAAEQRLELAERDLIDEYQAALEVWRKTVGAEIEAKHAGKIERAQQHLASITGEVAGKVG